MKYYKILFVVYTLELSIYNIFAESELNDKNSDCGCSSAVNRDSASDVDLDNSNEKKNQNVEKNDNVMDEKLKPNVVSSKLYDEMVYIEGGIYTIGTDKPIIVADGEGPSRKVKLDSFWLDVHEVSNAQFNKFTQETGYITEAERFGNSFVIEMFISEKIKSSIKQAVAAAPWWLPVNGSDWKHPTGPDSDIKHLMDHPVIHVSWNDAFSYCSWKKKRLPTEAEWEAACRNNKYDRLFPWGNLEKPNDEHRMNVWHGEFPSENTKDDGYASTCPVWKYPNQTVHGLKNMIGNVWEWVSDWWEINHHPNQPLVNPVGPSTGTDKVKKGGSFACTVQHCYRYRCGARSFNTPDSSAYNLGFRCASDQAHLKNSPDEKMNYDDSDISSNDDVVKDGNDHDRMAKDEF